MAKVRDYYSQFPFIRRTALAVAGPVRNNDLSGMYRAIAAFVRGRITYVPDPYGFELVVAPDVLLAEILRSGRAYGDCDDHVLLLNTMLMSVGYETCFIGVKQDSPDDTFNHVIAGLSLHGQWITIDPCDKSGRNVSYAEKYVVY